jgi:pyrroloquinoline quinone biosynthesis protein D
MPSITRFKVNLTMREVTMASRPRLRSQARLQWDSVREKRVLLSPEGVLVLNATADAMLALCDGQRSVSAIARDLSARYNHVVDQEVLTFFNRLLQKRLIEFDDET